MLQLQTPAPGWFHDNATKSRTKGGRVGWGNCWVVTGIGVRAPWSWDRPVCLPVVAVLCPSVHAHKQLLASQLVHRVAGALPGRPLHVVAGSAYAGTDGWGRYADPEGWRQFRQ